MKENELYELPGSYGWCRHGLVVIQKYCERLIAVDTYWGRPETFGHTWYEIDEVRDKLKFILDLTTARKVYRDEWDVFADSDRAHIPVGSSSEQYYVRNGALPSPTKQIAKLEREISEVEASMTFAQNRLKEHRQALANLKLQEGL